jgi:hypothetical protein
LKGALLMVRSCSDSGNESPKTLSTTSQINDIRRSSLLHVDNILSEDVVGRGGDPLHQIGGDPLHPPALECNRTVSRVVTDNCLNNKLCMIYIDQIYAIMPYKSGKCSKVASSGNFLTKI